MNLEKLCPIRCKAELLKREGKIYNPTQEELKKAFFDRDHITVIEDTTTYKDLVSNFYKIRNDSDGTILYYKETENSKPEEETITLYTHVDDFILEIEYSLKDGILEEIKKVTIKTRCIVKDTFVPKNIITRDKLTSLAVILKTIHYCKSEEFKIGFIQGYLN